MTERSIRLVAVRVLASGSAIIATILLVGWSMRLIAVGILTAPLAWMGLVLGFSAALAAPGPRVRLRAGLATLGHAAVLAVWFLAVRSEAPGAGADALAEGGAAWALAWTLAALATTFRPHDTGAGAEPPGPAAPDAITPITRT